MLGVCRALTCLFALSPLICLIFRFRFSSPFFSSLYYPSCIALHFILLSFNFSLFSAYLSGLSLFLSIYLPPILLVRLAILSLFITCCRLPLYFSIQFNLYCCPCSLPSPSVIYLLFSLLRFSFCALSSLSLFPVYSICFPRSLSPLVRSIYCLSSVSFL